jgi:hypothetical protein
MSRWILVLALVAPLAAQEEPLPKDIAAAHPEGQWKIRKADLYRYLARFESGRPAALAVLPEYMKLRLVEDEARRRKISVAEAEVDGWLKQLDARVKSEGQEGGLEAMRREHNMREEELRRKGRQWVLQEKVARAVLKEKDPTRADGPVADDSVIFVIDTLFKDAPKETEKLPEGIVARVREVDITEYEYGRALSIELPANEVLHALRGLILVEEVALLVGDRNPPSPEELAERRAWYLDVERTRIRQGLEDAPEKITDEMVEEVLKRRGHPMDLVLKNPVFLADARAIGHFRGVLTDDDLRKYYEEHQGQYGEQLKVARILVGARAQQVPGVARPLRTMKQGEKEASDLYERLRAGQDFHELARQKSEDPDALRDAGGVIPFWIHADSAGYQDTFKQAATLSPDGFSKPFFSQGRGFVIVKLLDRRPAREYGELKEAIRIAAARDRYGLWRTERTRAARINAQLMEE